MQNNAIEKLTFLDLMTFHFVTLQLPISITKFIHWNGTSVDSAINWISKSLGSISYDIVRDMHTTMKH